MFIIAFQCTPELIRTFIERANDIQDAMQMPLLDWLKKLWFSQFWAKMFNTYKSCGFECFLKICIIGFCL